MWVLLVTSALLVWLLALAVQAHQEAYRFKGYWLDDLDDKLSPLFSWNSAWDQRQMKKLVAQHNRRVDAHQAKSMS